MSTKPHLAVLDGMRGIAALAVLIRHVTETPHWGFPHVALAVDFFFMLSGFVVAHAYEAKLQNGLSFRTFASIRLIRLYPLIFLGVSAGIALTAIHFEQRHDISSAQLAWGAVLGLLLLPCYVYPQWNCAFPMNMPSWSLFFELTINAAYALVVRHLSTRRLAILCVVGAAALCGLGFGTGTIQDWGVNKVGFWFGFVRVLFSFSAGVLLFRFRRPVRHAPAIAYALPILLAALLLSPVHYSMALDLVSVVVLFPVMVHLGASISIGSGMNRIFLFAGELSYPVYITHHPLVRMFNQIEGRFHMDRIMLDCVEIAICIIFAYGALRLYDRPLRAALSVHGRHRELSSLRRGNYVVTVRSKREHVQSVLD
jgi:peptidoglycan/LPS O-acetylase OafA/YrhL